MERLTATALAVNATPSTESSEVPHASSAAPSLDQESLLTLLEAEQEKRRRAEWDRSLLLKTLSQSRLSMGHDEATFDGSPQAGSDRRPRPVSVVSSETVPITVPSSSENLIPPTSVATCSSFRSPKSILKKKAEGPKPGTLDVSEEFPAPPSALMMTPPRMSSKGSAPSSSGVSSEACSSPGSVSFSFASFVDQRADRVTPSKGRFSDRPCSYPCIHCSLSH